MSYRAHNVHVEVKSKLRPGCAVVTRLDQQREWVNSDVGRQGNLGRIYADRLVVCRQVNVGGSWSQDCLEVADKGWMGNLSVSRYGQRLGQGV